MENEKYETIENVVSEKKPRGRRGGRPKGSQNRKILVKRIITEEVYDYFERPKAVNE